MSENNSLGSLLKSKRESLKISLDDVVRILNVKKNDVIALEENTLNKITKHLYVIGFIRSYAKILHIKNEIIEEKIKDLHFDCNTKNKKHQLVNFDKDDLKNPTKDNIINAILILTMLYLLLMSFNQFKLHNLSITDLIINNMERAQ